MKMSIFEVYSNDINPQVELKLIGLILIQYFPTKDTNFK
jgi:hypothetical protein